MNTLLVFRVQQPGFPAKQFAVISSAPGHRLARTQSAARRSGGHLRGGKARRPRLSCPFFGVYTQLDAMQAAESDLSPDDQYHTAVLSAVGLKFSLDVIVTAAPTAGRPDVAAHSTRPAPQ